MSAKVALTSSRPSTLLAPRSVAIIGASSDPQRIGGRAIAYMLERNFKGPIYPVNPNRPDIQGLTAYASVADLPETPDAAIIAVLLGWRFKQYLNKKRAVPNNYGFR